MRRSLLAIAVLGSLLLGLTACGSLASLDLDDEDRRPPDPSPIPSGAQQVQVAITPDHVTTLTPDTVQAGEIYLIADGLDTLVRRQTYSEPSPGPLTDQQISEIRPRVSECARVSSDCGPLNQIGNPDIFQDTRQTWFTNGYCDPRDWPPHCKYLRVQLQPGRYLVLAGDTAAVLTVTP